MYHIQKMVVNFFWSLVVFIFAKLLRCDAIKDKVILRNLIFEQNTVIKIINHNKFVCNSSLALGLNLTFFV